ncbi:MAG: hypothetical protein GY841_14620 [FCB group bacterium]|nr:hypothetical protein [FCB group bacterium]
MYQHDEHIDFDSFLYRQHNDIRDLMRQFLQIASRGISRADYLERIFSLILSWSKSNMIRIVFFDNDRRYFCELKAKGSQPFQLTTSRISKGQADICNWCAAEDSALERICADIINKRNDPSMPWITNCGSFLAEDISALPDAVLPQKEYSGYQGLKISASCRSLVIIPIDGLQGRNGLLQMESETAGHFTRSRIDFLERLVQVLGFALDWRDLRIAHRERVKELTCVYGLIRLVAQADISLDTVLHNAVKLLPPAWLYSEVTAGKIIFDDKAYTTPGIENIVQSIKADIFVDETRRGEVVVGYTEEQPFLDEGPFLSEERHLINTIASELAFIIEQNLHTEEKLKLQAQLRRADRLATIGQLAAGVAHELNEPLANIMGFAQLASKDPGLIDQTKSDLDKIVSATLHAREIIKDLLVFAREAKKVRVSFNLNELIQDGLFFLESRFVKAGISLECELDPELPEIEADRSQILQVLTNLVVNSVQAMSDGGRLRIGTSFRGESIYLIVEDTGTGIDQKILNEIFNPFFTTKDINEGTGLGLSVVHGIITSHGGEIDVNSGEGKGTKFTIRLPRQAIPFPDEATS